MSKPADNLEKFPGANRPIPKQIAYPSDYGLALAAGRLMSEYGKDGAINKLIEMAQLLEADIDPIKATIGKRRIDPWANGNLPLPSRVVKK